MNNEADFKNFFKKSCRAQGGLVISLASSFYSGLPDLYVLMEGFEPSLIEAKWLKDIKMPFRRKINYSPMQRDLLDRCNEIRPHTAFGLVGYKFNGSVYAHLVPYALTHLAHDCGQSGLSIAQRGALLDVRGMFQHVTATPTQDDEKPLPPEPTRGHPNVITLQGLNGKH